MNPKNVAKENQNLANSYLALGSNLASPLKQVKTAISHIEAHEDITLIAQSSLRETKALVPPERPSEIQNNYINAVVAIQTTLSPELLLVTCQAIENHMGRKRSGQRWESRLIDIDILLYDNLILETENLIIPHPEMLNRDFVLEPLFEIAPDLVLPNGENLRGVL